MFHVYYHRCICIEIAIIKMLRRILHPIVINIELHQQLPRVVMLQTLSSLTTPPVTPSRYHYKLCFSVTGPRRASIYCALSRWCTHIQNNDYVLPYIKIILINGDIFIFQNITSAHCAMKNVITGGSICTHIYVGQSIVICPDTALIGRFMGPRWGPFGFDRTQVVPMLAQWTLLSGGLWEIMPFTCIPLAKDIYNVTVHIDELFSYYYNVSFRFTYHIAICYRELDLITSNFTNVIKWKYIWPPYI